jgi:hypothetical protein
MKLLANSLYLQDLDAPAGSRQGNELIRYLIQIVVGALNEGGSSIAQVSDRLF